MQQLIQGQGIVDVVNSYLGIALEYGVVGLALFSLFFAWVAILLFRAISKLDDSEEELKLIGISLFATLIGVLVTIATVSSIFLIPILYWILAGLCLAYIRVVNSRETTPQEEFNVRIRETPVPA